MERKKVSLDVTLPGGLIAECAAALGALVRYGWVDVPVVTPQRRGVRELFVTAWKKRIPMLLLWFSIAASIPRFMQWRFMQWVGPVMLLSWIRSKIYSNQVLRSENSLTQPGRKGNQCKMSHIFNIALMVFYNCFNSAIYTNVWRFMQWLGTLIHSNQV